MSTTITTVEVPAGARAPMALRVDIRPPVTGTEPDGDPIYDTDDLDCTEITGCNLIVKDQRGVERTWSTIISPGATTSLAQAIHEYASDGSDVPEREQYDIRVIVLLGAVQRVARRFRLIVI